MQSYIRTGIQNGDYSLASPFKLNLHSKCLKKTCSKNELSLTQYLGSRFSRICLLNKALCVTICIRKHINSDSHISLDTVVQAKRTNVLKAHIGMYAVAILFCSKRATVRKNSNQATAVENGKSSKIHQQCAE